MFEFSRKEMIATYFLLTSLIIGIGVKYTIDQHWWLPGTEVVDTDPESIKLKINLNNAEWYELIILPGIGETRAKAIVEYRKDKGPFQAIEQLGEVEGIGAETVKKIRDLVFINEPKNISPQSRRDRKGNQL
ncbi:MAG: helix-hairpin-helix domain-containing protein [Candidatus Scalindua sp.]|nr:helix-hairpin-helix domain-containing protein [Candidatus Scalindua sp.]